MVPGVAQSDGKFLIDAFIHQLYPPNGSPNPIGVRRQVIFAIAEGQNSPCRALAAHPGQNGLTAVLHGDFSGLQGNSPGGF
jgi:hypothetical protein